MLTPAKALDDIAERLRVEPLRKPEEFQAFYRHEIGDARGGATVEKMARKLKQAHGGLYYRCLLMGHPGSGKSTEMTRLEQQIGSLYTVVRINATDEFDFPRFRSPDLIVLMMMLAIETTARKPSEGGAGASPKDVLLKRLLDWLGETKKSRAKTERKAGAMEAEAGVGTSGILARFLSAKARIQAELRVAGERRTDTTEYRLKRLSEWVDLSNEILDACNGLLRKASNKELLFVVEDLEKSPEPKPIEDLFLKDGSLLRRLRAHMILTAPIALRYAHLGQELPFDYLVVPDTPVYTPLMQADNEGRDALKAVVSARVDPALFADGQLERLIVASGGNLRDLFRLIVAASDSAALQHRSRIGAGDARAAIVELKSQYKSRLAENPVTRDPIPYREKARKMVAIYHRAKAADVADRVLAELLRARCVQEFNGDTWFGLPPLIVEILKEQGRDAKQESDDALPPDAAGGIE